MDAETTVSAPSMMALLTYDVSIAGSTIRTPRLRS
jgi:hypothetical protein